MKDTKTIPTAEVPETAFAERPCKPGCGTVLVPGLAPYSCHDLFGTPPDAGCTCHRHNGTTTAYCSHECRREWRSLRPRPVERCPCDGAVRYRAALEVITIAIKGCVAEPDCERKALAWIHDIARRALALEPKPDSNR